jgi:para-aminobenzoate synthetase/4-amino-4-deoxychorismate lyase
MAAAIATKNGRRFPVALLESFSTGEFPRSFVFDELETVVQARTPDRVVAALREVEQAVGRGRHAAGFVAYEATAPLNPELPTGDNDALPLVWFGIFRKRSPVEASAEYEPASGPLISQPRLDISRSEYNAAVEGIRERIARGETYQVNFTARQRFTVRGDHFALYRRLCRNQRAPFCAWLDTGSHHILSTSPELFFSLRDGLLTMKPMKGTAPRSPLADDDRRARELLAASPKERAENLMIVDLVRNDLSRIAETGSVRVPALFQVESYPSVHQMISTVTARLKPDTDLVDIFRALFPCGSVTGAPKRRTMEIIRDLERSPRGVYCGAIGFVSPGGEATFSVAIRTTVIETATAEGVMGVGSGITWDSEPEAEFAECLTKSAFLTRETAGFALIESLRWDRNGYLLLERHLKRLEESAARFGFPFSRSELLHRLAEQEQTLTGIHKVRVVLAPDGGLTLEQQEIDNGSAERPTVAVALSTRRSDPANPLLYHKTTRRALYDEELRSRPECGEVLFLNLRGELTEGSATNLVLQQGSEFLTPALECGLLPGTLREELLQAGALKEAVLTRDDLERCEAFWLINSVRGWRRGQLVSSGTVAA